MKKSYLIMFVALFMSLYGSIEAQTFLKKELKVENRSEDGFEYKWYLYTYLRGRDTLYAAFDLNGKRITPNSMYVNKHRGDIPYYSGGGIFVLLSNKYDGWSRFVDVGYNTRGELVFPESLMALHISYEGKGLVNVVKRSDYGTFISALYNVKGESIIPFSMGYKLISVYPKDGNIWCEIADANGKTIEQHTYSLDGKYYAIGEYRYGKYDRTGVYRLSDPDELELFNKYKRPAPYAPSALSDTPQPTPWPEESPAARQPERRTEPTPQPQPRQLQPMQVWVPCACSNQGYAGQCGTCLGLGWLGTGSNPRQCWNCGGSGKCTMCAGQGGHNEIQYR